MTDRPADGTDTEPNGSVADRFSREPAEDAGPSEGVDEPVSTDGDDVTDEASLGGAEDLSDWEGEYVDRVADRLSTNYDLERDRVVGAERFDLYGKSQIESSKHVLHPVVTDAHHEAYEHLFVTREPRVTQDRLESLITLGHELAVEWIDANADHYSTTFTFVVIAPDLPENVTTFVERFSERRLLKLGYNGRYTIRVAVAAPERKAFVSSPGAELEPVFVHWETEDVEPSGGRFRRFGDRLGI
ncbi:hypothetical protein [Natrarchaeobius chitinivorans]|uniref:DUF8052 domain-containing protein n=1 Tax=Natrarchaeobius chitinivorans TaxID=1679083 RepID=A0A3N6MCZ4_NATCH|nr:hypothetical protein [Natrarchaeobius chitinivorans]RQG93391.1 hypothetical protein EA473_15290 [Natrarchaeobius chitinivorans]